MQRVVWSPTGKKSLERTSDFATELWNEQVKEEFLTQLDFRISQLQKNPELAPTFEDSDIRKLVIHKSVSLFYQRFPKYLKLLLAKSLEATLIINLLHLQILHRINPASSY